VQEAAELLGSSLQKDFKNLVGPAAPVVNRIRSMYLMEILIKLPKDAAHIQAQKKVINNYVNLLKSEKKFRSVVVIPDVDPL
jgi:primosomal protein N' (replication factor Y)